MTADRQRAGLTRDECLRMVGSAPFGRIVFTVGALPAVQPVAHLLDGAQIIIRARLGAAISSAVHGSGTIVAYQADRIDPVQRAGWSVVIIGRAHRVTSEAQAARYRESLPPWIDGEMDEVIAIDADVVSGFRILPVPSLAALG
ncbi:MAG: pyridoxamine 5'-phosphate oxidase family protein [Actinomycetota bacterium]|nr:pyridoxamine 5'-phosphate oxidase family protein [Actinomycetota bacterium]